MTVWDELVDSGLLSPSATRGRELHPISLLDERGPHQFLVLLKPELLDAQAGVHCDAVWNMVVASLERAGVRIHGVRWFAGEELGATGAIERHYGAINDVSRRGLNALTQDARTALDGEFGESSSGALGGHQFIKAHQSVQPAQLQLAFQSASVIRLGPGAYAGWIELAGLRALVLNGFHPAQVDHFTRPGARLIALECRSSRPWQELRADVAGATDPTAAAAGSIRAELLQDAAALRLDDVSVGRNGVHLSAGPLEGCAEVLRFFDESDSANLVVVHRLLKAGVDSRKIQTLLANPRLASGRMLFDETEDLDLDSALEIALAVSHI